VTSRPPSARSSAAPSAGAVADDRDPLPLTQDLARPDRQRDGIGRERHADRLPARIAQPDRAAVELQRRVQHVHQHRLVARRHQRDVRQAAQVCDVERAVVRRPVVADQPRAVHRQHDRQPLEA
jgi:hypothetical protein